MSKNILTLRADYAKAKNVRPKIKKNDAFKILS
jgi:hypothetical protein